MAAQLIVVTWRDIPAQVIAKRGRDSVKLLLSARFQEAIDRAAMRAGKGSSDAYLADWQRQSHPCPDGPLAPTAQALAAQLEADYSPERLEQLIRNQGLTPSAD